MAGIDKKSVLIVDDDEDVLSLVALILESEGYDVKVAKNGREGLESLQREMPDLVLLDMKMPVMNGWEFAREFHARYKSRVPIIVITAAQDAKKRARETAANGWIGKPFDLDTLLDTVGRYVA